jgi:hypothetical protein
VVVVVGRKGDLMSFCACRPAAAASSRDCSVSNVSVTMGSASRSRFRRFETIDVLFSSAPSSSFSSVTAGPSSICTSSTGSFTSPFAWRFLLFLGRRGSSAPCGPSSMTSNRSSMAVCGCPKSTESLYNSEGSYVCARVCRLWYVGAIQKVVESLALY